MCLMLSESGCHPPILACREHCLPNCVALPRGSPFPVRGSWARLQSRKGLVRLALSRNRIGETSSGKLNNFSLMEGAARDQTLPPQTWNLEGTHWSLHWWQPRRQTPGQGEAGTGTPLLCLIRGAGTLPSSAPSSACAKHDVMLADLVRR